MCYICNFFAWTLDLIQRALTFVLSCWLAFSVCCGLSIAIIAGVAYGYNYCLAEFITLTRSDVRVYMRRGQFHDKPDTLYSRRKHGDEDDLFPYNISDYNQEVDEIPIDDSLSEKLMKDQETQKYSDKLSKYSEEKAFEDSDQKVDLPEIRKVSIYYKMTTSRQEPPTTRRASYVPNRLLPTTILQSGSSEIVMRQFEPMPEVISDMNFNENENYAYKVMSLQDEITSEATSVEEIEKEIETVPPDIRIRLEDSPPSYDNIRKTIKMRHWRTTAKSVIGDYSPDMDEDNVVYKAV